MRKADLLRSLSVVLFLAACSTVHAAELQLADLMNLLAQTKAARATFVEKKYIGIVDQPVESSGELSFNAPDRLEKRTLKPKPESLLLDGSTLTVDQPGKRHATIKLQDYPEVAAFVESIRGTLAGDRSALERVYKLEIKGSLDKWQLSLVPTEAKMLKVITRIRMAGVQADIKTIEFEQADGDRSEMTISKVALQ